jgi:hypothetical protein
MVFQGLKKPDLQEWSPQHYQLAVWSPHLQSHMQELLLVQRYLLASPR